MLFEKIPLEADEKIIKVIRKHWWLIAVETVTVIIFVFLPLLAFNFLTNYLANKTGLTLPVESFTQNYQLELWFVYLVWILALWVTLANFWTDYYLDLWAITNRRVILVDQRGFFRRFISSFRLERLQDMNIEVNGLIATLLDYGTIEAQTASPGDEEFKSHHMPKPREIKAMIIRAADELTTTQAKRVSDLKDQGL